MIAALLAGALVLICATKRDLPLAIPMCELGHILLLARGGTASAVKAPLASWSKLS